MRHFLILLAILALSACGGASSARYQLREDERDKVSNAFMESVREYYSKRTEGRLLDPGISGDHIKFVYRYEKIINGDHSEEIRLELRKSAIARNNAGESKALPPAFAVGAWFQRDGADPEIPAVRDAIIAGMKARMVEFTPYNR
jgi:hypothetical protein